MNIDKIVTKIGGDVNAFTKVLVDSYTELEATLSEKESMVQKVMADYVAYRKLIDGIQAEHKARGEELNRRESELLENVREHEVKVASLRAAEKEYASVAKNLTKLRTDIAELTAQKTLLSDEVEALYKGVKDVVSTMEGKMTELRALEDEVRKNKAVSESDMLMAHARLEDAKKAREEMEKDTKEQREFITAKAIELKDKEVALRAKEETLRIIEGRYTKLFGDQGIKIRV